MASQSWYGVTDYVKDVSASDNLFIVRLGEDTMLAAYIVTKLGHPELVDKAVAEIKSHLIEIHDDYNRIIEISGVTKYLEFCQHYGSSRVTNAADSSIKNKKT